MRLWILLAAAFPCIFVTSEAQPDSLEQIGTNDFQISDMDGEPHSEITGHSDVVFNTHAAEYFAVWSGTDADPAPSEVYGQRLDASGAPVGPFNFLISQISQGNPSFGSFSPRTVYNPDRQEYLVVWRGKDFLLGSNDFEIYGQRLDSLGSPLGGNFRISDTSVSGNADAFNPAIAYNSNDREYLVVWYADHDTAGLANGEFEIFAQRLDELGNELGNDLRISEIGGTGDPNDDAFEPDVAFDPVNRWYLVVWHADSAAGALVDDEFEIYGQLLDASGQQIGADDFRISDAGGFGDADFDATWPAVELHPVTREWWIVWHGNDNEGGLIETESEIFGQRLLISGAEVGANDFRISAMGGVGNAGFDAFVPDLAYTSAEDGVVVTWSGTDRGAELEVYGARVRSDGVPVSRSCPLSDLGPVADPSYFADFPAISRNGAGDQFLVIFKGRDEDAGHLVGELDLFGQRIVLPFLVDSFETGDFSTWTSAVP